MSKKQTPIHTAGRGPAEFLDFPSYFGARLYPRIGALALVGVGLLAVFSIMDWTIAPSPSVAWWMIHNRLLAAALLAVCGVIMVRSRSGYGPARATLILGVASFLLLALNYIVLTRHHELVAFTLVFFLFGLNALAPLLKLIDYAVASVLALALVALAMAVANLPASDFVSAGFFAPPLQAFLGATIAASQRASREQYGIAHQNFLLSTIDPMTELLNRRCW